MKKTFKGNDFTAVFTDKDGYFSFTGDFDGGSGAVGDRLVKNYPVFKPLNDVHLADSVTGEPMHGLANAYYHFENSLNEDGNPDAAIKKLEDYWNITLTLNQRLHIIENISTGGSGQKILTVANANNNGLIKDTKTAVSEVYEVIKPLFKERVQTVREYSGNINSDMTTITDTFDPEAEFSDPEKAQVLANMLGCDISVIEEEGNNYYSAEGREYQILTDEEADEAAEESLNDYIDECLDIPDTIKPYFNREAWIADAIRIDGRGHILNSYDGSEWEENIDGTYYYIYRR